MDFTKGQIGILNSFQSPIDQEALRGYYVSPDPKVIATCRINPCRETSETLINTSKYSGPVDNAQFNFKPKIHRCREITAKDKKLHILFCVSIVFMLLCLIIVLFAFANMVHRAQKSDFTTDDIKYDALLIVFGLAAFVFVLVAFFSQRHADQSIFMVARTFLGNSKEWTYTSFDKPCDETSKEWTCISINKLSDATVGEVI